MTVRADDIAFRGLLQDARRSRPSDHPRDAVAPRVRVDVIKIHRARREALMAVRARHISKTIE
jgi:hypothetical protein